MRSAPDVRAQSKQNLLFLCPTVQKIHTKETGIQTNSKFHINGDRVSLCSTRLRPNSRISPTWNNPKLRHFYWSLSWPVD